MSAPYTAIRAAFATKLLTYTSVPSIAWENVPFTPVIGTAYIKPVLLPGEPQQAEIGTNGINRHYGIFQISIFAPAGKGIATISSLRDGLIDFFKRGTTLTHSGVTVRIRKAYPAPQMQETDWLHQPITIQFTADAPN